MLKCALKVEHTSIDEQLLEPFQEEVACQCPFPSSQQADEGDGGIVNEQGVAGIKIARQILVTPQNS